MSYGKQRCAVLEGLLADANAGEVARINTLVRTNPTPFK